MEAIELIRKKSNPELLLVGFFLVVSTYMFLDARSFSAAASRFPSFSSLLVIILSIYVGVQNLYNKDENSTEDSDLVQDIMSTTMDETELNKEIENESSSTVHDSPYRNSRHFILMFLTLLFVIFSYIIGIFYASIVFMSIYGIWREKKWYEILISVVLTYLIGQFFINILDVNLHTGIFDLRNNI